jgi:hypothetical protein
MHGPGGRSKLMKRVCTVVILFVCATVCGSGCALNKLIANRTADVLAAGSSAFNEEPDLDFARQALPGSLKMAEALLKSSPENPTILSMLAQGYCSYAFGFLEDGEQRDVERAKAFYLRGYRYGLASLDRSVRDFAAKDLEGFERAVSRVQGDDIPRLFWAAYCLAGWVNLNKTEVSAIAELSRAEAMFRQVLARDEKFYHGGPHVFYGAFFGGRPRILGGDPAKAREHLERAVGISSGRFLIPKLYLAQFVAVPAQDEGLFERTLREILEAPVDLMPEERLANQIAKRKAEKLLAMKKDLF